MRETRYIDSRMSIIGPQADVDSDLLSYPIADVLDSDVSQLIDTVTFTGADFSIQHVGVCRMNPELARAVALLTLKRCEGASTSQKRAPVVGTCRVISAERDGVTVSTRTKRVLPARLSAVIV